MISRYSTDEMVRIWSDETRLQRWFEVEMAALEAWEHDGVVPKITFDAVKIASESIDWNALCKRASDIEKNTHHDVIAFLTALEQELGEKARYIHLGMTSSDVVDTAFALSLRLAASQIMAALSELLESLKNASARYKNTFCLGRTHGQAAQPTTFGLKLLGYVAEIKRGQKRLQNAIEEISYGKISGAVGNYGNVPPSIEKKAMASLDLKVEEVSTQIIPRDKHAVFFTTLAIIGGCLERLALEIRHLMRTEVAEAFEPFGSKQQGSSAMPHKKNPILTENITGLVRLLRNYAGAALENQALWHERDISHSSVERVIAPDATAILDFAIRRMNTVVAGLVVDEKKMSKHLDSTSGLVFSEAVLLELVKRGVARQEAYGWVQKASIAAREGNSTFWQNLQNDKNVAKYLTMSKIEQLFNVRTHLRYIDKIFERVNNMLA